MNFHELIKTHHKCETKDNYTFYFVWPKIDKLITEVKLIPSSLNEKIGWVILKIGVGQLPLEGLPYSHPFNFCAPLNFALFKFSCTLWYHWNRLLLSLKLLKDLKLLHKSLFRDELTRFLDYSKLWCLLYQKDHRQQIGTVIWFRTQRKKYQGLSFSFTRKSINLHHFLTITHPSIFMHSTKPFESISFLWPYERPLASYNFQAGQVSEKYFAISLVFWNILWHMCIFLLLTTSVII